MDYRLNTISDLWKYIQRGDKSENIYFQKRFKMLYIGFSNKSHKYIARIVCRYFKHCAPVVIHKNKCEMYQFTKPHQITIISIKIRDLKILEEYGWKFIKYKPKFIHNNACNIHAITCVQFTKKFCGIKNISLQTPDSLFKYLSNK